MKILLMASLFLFSAGAFADSNLDSMPANMAFMQALKDKGHLVCHVTKTKVRKSATILEIELNVANGKADVNIVTMSAEQGRQVQNFTQRAWILDKAYDDYSNEMQYEALVNLTDDSQNFILVQFYDSHAEAAGVLQVGTDSYDLLCK